MFEFNFLSVPTLALGSCVKLQHSRGVQPACGVVSESL